MSSRHHSSSGGGSAESKLEKEKTRLIQEKCQAMLNDMLRDEDNKYCVDCDAKGPRWASWNLGIFLCIRCAGIHRNLGVHISKVKSVNLDTWTPEQVMTMAQLGNSRARAIYEANLPDTTRRPQTDVALESFIRAKYEHKKYIAKEYIPTPIEKPNWDHEIEEMLKKKKKSAAAGTGEIKLPPVTKKFGDTNRSSAKTTSGAKTPETKAKNQSAENANVSNSTNNNNNNSTTTGDLAGDLLGLTLDSVATTNVQSPTAADGTRSGAADPFASPTKEPSSSSSAANDLFLLDSGASAKLMSKESIMSLYGKGGSGGGGMPTQQQQQQGLGGLGQLAGLNLGGGSGTGAGLNSLAGLNPFLGPSVGMPSNLGYQAQAPPPSAQAFGGFGMPQQQVPTTPQQQQFMFNNSGGLVGGSGLGLTSAQHQFQQFQSSTSNATAPNPMMNQYNTYPNTNPMMGMMGMSPVQNNPYQQQQIPMQMAPGGVAAAAAQYAARSPQQNFIFTQPTPAAATTAPLQSSPPNFLN